MTSPIDDQWDFINPLASAEAAAMAEPIEQSPALAATEPKIEVTINTKGPKPPKLPRQNSDESAIASEVEVEEIIRPRAARRPRRNSFSPVRIHSRYPPPPIPPLLASSTQLLENIGYDGIADMPFPGRNSIYLTTYPFTDRDVKKWAWLFTHGVEDVWLTTGEKTGQEEDDYVDFDDGYYYGPGHGVRVARNRLREYDVTYVDIPSVYLSRALDTAVVPEDTTEKVRYLIVVKNRNGPASGVKLLTAESRKAAGIILYYQALTGNLVAFVGAVVGAVGKKARKFKRVEGLDEAKATSESGAIGVIC